MNTPQPSQESIVEYLETCALKAAQQAKSGMNANNPDYALLALDVCGRALELRAVAIDQRFNALRSTP